MSTSSLQDKKDFTMSGKEGRQTTLQPYSLPKGEEHSELASSIDREAERKLLRKIDWNLMPLIMMLYLASFLDRSVSCLSKGGAGYTPTWRSRTVSHQTTPRPGILTLPLLARVFCTEHRQCSGRWNEYQHWTQGIRTQRRHVAALRHIYYI